MPYSKCSTPRLGSISAALSCRPSPRMFGRSAGSFPEQRPVIEPASCSVTKIPRKRADRSTSTIASIWGGNKLGSEREYLMAWHQISCVKYSPRVQMLWALHVSDGTEPGHHDLVRKCPRARLREENNGYVPGQKTQAYFRVTLILLSILYNLLTDYQKGAPLDWLPWLLVRGERKSRSGGGKEYFCLSLFRSLPGARLTDP